jgi:hypothetical protein
VIFQYSSKALYYSFVHVLNKPSLRTRLVLLLSLISFITFANQAKAAPHIDSIKWGEIIVSHSNKKQAYRDAKLWPEKSKEWDWKEAGTRHVPGIQIADLKEFIDQVDIVVLTRGMDLVLQVPQTTIDYVRAQGKECHVGQTKQMVELYNKLVGEGKKVGGLFHSTC